MIWISLFIYGPNRVNSVIRHPHSYLDFGGIWMSLSWEWTLTNSVMVIDRGTTACLWNSSSCGVPNCIVNTIRPINEERDSSHLYFPTSSSYSYTGRYISQADANTFFKVTGVDWAGCADPWHDFPNLLYTQNDQRVAAGVIVPKQLLGLNTNLSTLKVVSLVHLRGDHHTRSRR